jgi:hypothetical protein
MLKHISSELIDPSKFRRMADGLPPRKPKPPLNLANARTPLFT